MNHTLIWVPKNEIRDLSSFTSKEIEVVCAVDNPADWYRSEFDVSFDDTGGNYLFCNFGYIQNIKQIAFYINGVKIGTTKSACVQAAFLVLKSLVKNGTNYIWAEVILDATIDVWENSVEAGKLQESLIILPNRKKVIEELPGALTIEAPQRIGNVEQVTVSPDGIIISFSQGSKALMTIYRDGIFRLAFESLPFRDRQIKSKFEEICLDELEENLQCFLDYKLFEDANKYTIITDLTKIEIEKNEFCISVFDLLGKMVFYQQALLLFEKASGFDLAMQEDEHIFGLGQNGEHGLEKTGRSEDMWVRHDFIACDTPIPFYISTEGYGFLLNNSHHSIFDMGSTKKDSALLSMYEGKPDYFFIYGPQPKKIISSYSAITGKPKLPPKWAFGFWQTSLKQLGQLDYVEIVNKFRKDGIPLDVIGLDIWWQNHYNELEWNLNNYPSPDDFVTFLNENNVHLCLWTAPFVNRTCNNYREGLTKGFFMKDSEGNHLPVYWWLGAKAGLLDFTNDEVVEWWGEQLRRLIKQGIDLFKIDGGDTREVPAELTNYQGSTGNELHNLYPLYFARAYHKIFQNERANQRVITWERTGFAGSGKYPITWGGDQPADFSGTRILIKGGQGAGLAGIPFWAPDVGGFADCEGKTEEFFVRSFQWGLLSPISRAHGMNSFPWDFGLPAFKIISEYIKLRYRLMPYIYSSAHAAAVSGIPIMRSLFLEYPDDRETYKVDYQYFFGDSILVAPICDYSNSPTYEAKREIYLPTGEWIDYWTDEVFEGERYISYIAPFEVLPMFVRGGSIIVYGSEIQSMAQYRSNNLEVHIYPSQSKASAIIYDDDGITLGYRTGECEETKIEEEMSERTIKINVYPTEGKFRGQITVIDIHFIIHLAEPVNQVKLGGKIIEKATVCNEGANWRYDDNKHLLHIITKVDKRLGLFIESEFIN
ncbi:MAG: glycoside hydrolase family 31 protein [Anaerolineaceae bacterium]|nr:glycoside hydrolase family 31 protein [Anaerolineaceae bacterium]